MPPDRLAAVGDPKLRRALLLARSRRGPFTADEAAAALGIHRNVARRRLDRLVEAGFLSVARERRTGQSGPGAGRPAKVYRVAPELEELEFPNRRYAALIGLLVERLSRRGREVALRETGQEFGRVLASAAGLERARGERVGLDGVSEVLGALGFHASVESLDEDAALITVATCPLRPLVMKLWPAAEQIDEGMWEGLIEATADGVAPARVQCEFQRCLDAQLSCRIRVALRS